MGAFVSKHPILTFFLALAAFGTVKVIARGWAPMPSSPPDPWA